MAQSEKLGSLNNFAAEQGVDPGSPEALAAYSEVLAEYRALSAANLGVTVSQLHSGEASQQEAVAGEQSPEEALGAAVV